MIDFFSGSVVAGLDFLKQPPISTVLILVLSGTINLIMSLANRRTMDLEQYRKMMEESHYARQEVMAAMRSGNQRRISRAQNRQQEVNQAQLKMSGDRMKTTFFFIIPLLILWPILGNFFGRGTIAYIPFNAPIFGTSLNLVNWYFLCSITTNLIFQRILGFTFEIEPKEIST